MKVASKVADAGVVAVSGAALYGLYMNLIGISKDQEKTKELYKKAEKLAKEGKKDEVDKIVKKFKNQHNPVMIRVNNTLTKIFTPRNLVEWGIGLGSGVAMGKVSGAIGKKLPDKEMAGMAGGVIGAATVYGVNKVAWPIHNKLKDVSKKKSKETGNRDVYNTKVKFSEKGIKEWNDKFEKLRDSIDKS